MSGLQLAVAVVLGAVAWVGLALCLAIAICLSIREADRRAAEGGPGGPLPDAGAVPTPEALGSHVDVFL